MYQGKRVFESEQKRDVLKGDFFEKDLKKKEQAFYSGELRYSEMINFLQQAEVEGEELIQKRDMLLELYSGMMKQEEVNMDAVRFNLSLQREATQKNSSGLTKKEVGDLFAEYEKKATLESNEEEAINFYQNALENWQDNFYIDKQKVRALICDIKYRRAKRVTDPETRKSQLTKIKAEYRDVVNDTWDKGIKAEMQFVSLVNDWAEKQGQEHLIEAYGAMPLDDHKEKVDVEIVVGGKILNVNLKSYRSSSDVADFNQELLAKERAKVGYSSVEIAVLDSDEIQEVWSLLGEDHPDAKQKRRLTKLSKNLLGSVKEGILLKELAEPEKVKRPRKGPTKKQLIEKHSNIPNLKKWGYLTEDDAMSVDAIMSAKKQLESDLEDKKIFEKLRAEV